jgi:hypothetical protein
VLAVTNPGTLNSAVGDNLALAFAANCLTSGVSWTYAATGLPSGLTISSTTGAISCTITGTANAYAVTVTASDGQGASASASFTWNVSVLAVTNPGTLNSAVGDVVSLPITASGLPSGGSWTYAATGLPSGLTIGSTSGVISGTITGAANAYAVTVTASDGNGASASASLSWNVSVLAVTDPGVQNGAVGDTVSLPISASGLPGGDSWTYAATGLPSGLTINTATGAISGTITGAANAHAVNVTASDGHGGSASASFTWNVSVLAVTNPGTQNSAAGSTISPLSISASGLPSGDSWNFGATGLPSGLTINSTSGVISGTITAAANAYAVTVTASDGHGASASASFTWNVSLSVTNPGTQNSADGDTVSLPIQANGIQSGASWTYSATGLPASLSGTRGAAGRLCRGSGRACRPRPASARRPSGRRGPTGGAGCASPATQRNRFGRRTVRRAGSACCRTAPRPAGCPRVC